MRYIKYHLLSSVHQYLRIGLIFLLVITYLGLPLLNTQRVAHAANDCSLSVTGPWTSVAGQQNTFYYDSAIDNNTNSIKKNVVFKFDTTKVAWNSLLTDYRTSPLSFVIEKAPRFNKRETGVTHTGNLSFVQYTGDDNFSAKDGKYKVQLVGTNNDEVLCEGYYAILPKLSCNIDSITADSPKQDVDSNWTVTISNISIQSSELSSSAIYLQTTVRRIPDKCSFGESNCIDVIDIAGQTSLTYFLGRFVPSDPGDYDVSVVAVPKPLSSTQEQVICGPKAFHVYERGQPTNTPAPPTVPPPPGTTYTPIPQVPSLAPICEQIDSKFFTDCDKCINRDHGIWTAIGCVPTDLELILKDYVFVYGVGIAGGIAFLYFIYGVFLILTSAGNAEKVAEAKEIIISALSGLLLIIFSVFLLRVIGVDVLRLPGFS